MKQLISIKMERLVEEMMLLNVKDNPEKAFEIQFKMKLLHNILKEYEKLENQLNRI